MAEKVNMDIKWVGTNADDRIGGGFSHTVACSVCVRAVCGDLGAR